MELCQSCVVVNAERLAAVRLRLAGPVDWEDVKRYGIYDRHGRPIATVQSIGDQLDYSMMSTGPMGPTNDPDKVIYCREVRR